MAILRSENLDALVQRCLAATPSSPVVFFAGSGVSWSYPSILPTARQMIAETVEAVSPAEFATDAAELGREKEMLASALPELYYEMLAQIGGATSIKLWEVLNFWSNHEDLRGLGLGPNIGHLALVYVAWKTRSPIITTNFDTLFEEAARKLLLTPVSLEVREPRDPTEVMIWKVHGSADRPDSIRTTLRDITKADWPMLDHMRSRFELPDATPCLIGYSGRDIDLFPFIAGWRRDDPIRWVAPEFRGDHMIQHEDVRFLAVRGTSDEFAMGLVHGLTGSDARIQVLRDSLALTTGSVDLAGLRETYSRLVRGHVEGVLNALLPRGDPRRILVHAFALSSIGENERSRSYADLYLQLVRTPAGANSQLTCRALLLRASLAHELSQYEDSEHFSESARTLAVQEGLAPLEAQATMSADEALRMQHLPGLDYREWVHFVRPTAVRVFARFVWHAIRWRTLARQAMREADQDVVRAGFAYLEHLVRLGAIVQGLVRRLSMPVILQYVGRWWGRIERQSYSVGYAHGIANARKYGERIGVRAQTSPALSAPILFGLLSARTGRAITYRDRGDHLADAARRASTPKSKGELQQQAVEQYQLAFAEAQAGGNRSLALKVLIKRRILDVNFRVRRDEVDGLLNDIQGAAYRRVGSGLLEWLSGNRIDRV